MSRGRQRSKSGHSATAKWLLWYSASFVCEIGCLGLGDANRKQFRHFLLEIMVPGKESQWMAVKTVHGFAHKVLYSLSSNTKVTAEVLYKHPYWEGIWGLAVILEGY